MKLPGGFNIQLGPMSRSRGRSGRLHRRRTGGGSRGAPRSAGGTLVFLLVAGLMWWWEQPSGSRLLPTPSSLSPAAPAHVSPAVERSETPASLPYDLAADEARGGHTLARHVGRSEAELRDRLRREPQLGLASTFPDEATAAQVVRQTLDRYAATLLEWQQQGPERENLALSYSGNTVIGRSARRGHPEIIPCTDANVVLSARGNPGFIVLTAYPEPPRGR
jgi:hypothetical protein